MLVKAEEEEEEEEEEEDGEFTKRTFVNLTPFSCIKLSHFIITVSFWV